MKLNFTLPEPNAKSMKSKTQSAPELAESLSWPVPEDEPVRPKPDMGTGAAANGLPKPSMTALRTPTVAVAHRTMPPTPRKSRKPRKKQHEPDIMDDDIEMDFEPRKRPRDSVDDYISDYAWKAALSDMHLGRRAYAQRTVETMDANIALLEHSLTDLKKLRADMQRLL